MTPLEKISDETTRTTYELARLQSYTERWHFLILALVCIAAVAFVVYMYRRDSVELRPGVGVFLVGLRILALVGILAYYFDLEKRTQREVTRNSKVLLLVDTSQSMGLHDSDSSSVPSTPNRLEQVVSVLADSPLLAALRKKHDVAIVRFDADSNRVVSFNKLPSGPAKAGEPAAPTEKSAAAAPASKTQQVAEWRKALLPQGVETKLGQTLRQLINDERANPLAAVVVFSDGGQNAGLDPAAAIEAARDAKVPVYTVGIGSDRRPINVRISDFVAPSRAYPGDSFFVTGYLQAQELSDRTVTVELLSRASAGSGKGDEGELEGTERVTLGKSGEVTPVKFEIMPKETGRRTYRLRVKPPAEDNNANDDQQEADIEIVDRKTKVLLFASGPTREYIFLRNQLRRDKEFIVDVLLQTVQELREKGQTAISQDANKILDDFPETPQELFEYDAIVAFDPDWRKLDEDQIDLVERWVAEKAGGLIAIAGPVEMDQWTQDPKLSKIRSLYPVELNRRFAGLDDGRYGSETPWPIDFTRDGMEAEFLWLADSASNSQRIWASFPGVFGYYSVRGPKPGATVFGRYSDPEAAGGDGQPVYMAGHFYGAGRVFYLASGEMWRLRALDDNYFEQIYTKLVRHVSQGRLLVGSSRGMLLVDRDRYLLGNTVVVRAQLSNPQFEPLEAARVPLQVVRPDSIVDTVQLAADTTRKGMFVGQFTALQEGTYRLELALPESDAEQLTRRILIKVPDLERENPQRNDALLSEIASRTGGLYYIGADSVLGRRGAKPLANQLPDRTEITYLAGVIDQDFDRRWMQGILAFICGALFLEWLVRRLLKLA